MAKRECQKVSTFYSVNVDPERRMAWRLYVSQLMNNAVFCLDRRAAPVMIWPVEQRGKAHRRSVNIHRESRARQRHIHGCLQLSALYSWPSTVDY